MRSMTKTRLPTAVILKASVLVLRNRYKTGCERACKLFSGPASVVWLF